MKGFFDVIVEEKKNRTPEEKIPDVQIHRKKTVVENHKLFFCGRGQTFPVFLKVSLMILEVSPMGRGELPDEPFQNLRA